MAGSDWLVDGTSDLEGRIGSPNRGWSFGRHVLYEVHWPHTSFWGWGIDAAAPAASEIRARLRGGRTLQCHGVTVRIGMAQFCAIEAQRAGEWGLLVSMAETCAPGCCGLTFCIMIYSIALSCSPKR